MKFENEHGQQLYDIDELIDMRKDARLKKDWSTSDEIRDYLDSLLVFIFDVKDGQDVYHLNKKYFDEVYEYNIDGVKWSETKTQKIERLHSIKFETRRKFVEWNIQKDIRADKYFEAWLYSTRESIKAKTDKKDRVENIPTF